MGDAVLPFVAVGLTVLSLVVAAVANPPSEVSRACCEWLVHAVGEGCNPFSQPWMRDLSYCPLT